MTDNPNIETKKSAFVSRERVTGELRSKQGESFESILRRFFRDTQQNGILSEVKKRRFHERPISRRKRREIATRKSARRLFKRGY